MKRLTYSILAIALVSVFAVSYTASGQSLLPSGSGFVDPRTTGGIQTPSAGSFDSGGTGGVLDPVIGPIQSIVPTAPTTGGISPTPVSPTPSSPTSPTRTTTPVDTVYIPIDINPTPVSPTPSSPTSPTTPTGGTFVPTVPTTPTAPIAPTTPVDETPTTGGTFVDPVDVTPEPETRDEVFVDPVDIDETFNGGVVDLGGDGEQSAKERDENIVRICTEKDSSADCRECCDAIYTPIIRACSSYSNDTERNSCVRNNQNSQASCNASCNALSASFGGGSSPVSSGGSSGGGSSSAGRVYIPKDTPIKVTEEITTVPETSQKVRTVRTYIDTNTQVSLTPQKDFIEVAVRKDIPVVSSVDFVSFENVPTAGSLLAAITRSEVGVDANGDVLLMSDADSVAEVLERRATVGDFFAGLGSAVTNAFDSIFDAIGSLFVSADDDIETVALVEDSSSTFESGCELKNQCTGSCTVASGQAGICVSSAREVSGWGSGIDSSGKIIPAKPGESAAFLTGTESVCSCEEAEDLPLPLPKEDGPMCAGELADSGSIPSIEPGFSYTIPEEGFDFSADAGGTTCEEKLVCVGEAKQCDTITQNGREVEVCWTECVNEKVQNVCETTGRQSGDSFESDIIAKLELTAQLACEAQAGAQVAESNEVKSLAVCGAQGFTCDPDAENCDCSVTVDIEFTCTVDTESVKALAATYKTQESNSEQSGTVDSASSGGSAKQGSTKSASNVHVSGGGTIEVDLSATWDRLQVCSLESGSTVNVKSAGGASTDDGGGDDGGGDSDGGGGGGGQAGDSEDSLLDEIAKLLGGIFGGGSNSAETPAQKETTTEEDTTQKDDDTQDSEPGFLERLAGNLGEFLDGLFGGNEEDLRDGLTGNEDDIAFEDGNSVAPTPTFEDEDEDVAIEDGGEDDTSLPENDSDNTDNVDVEDLSGPTENPTAVVPGNSVAPTPEEEEEEDVVVEEPTDTDEGDEAGDNVPERDSGHPGIDDVVRDLFDDGTDTVEVPVEDAEPIEEDEPIAENIEKEHPPIWDLGRYDTPPPVIGDQKEEKPPVYGQCTPPMLGNSLKSGYSYNTLEASDVVSPAALKEKVGILLSAMTAQGDATQKAALLNEVASIASCQPIQCSANSWCGVEVVLDGSKKGAPHPDFPEIQCVCGAGGPSVGTNTVETLKTEEKKEDVKEEEQTGPVSCVAKEAPQCGGACTAEEGGGTCGAAQFGPFSSCDAVDPKDQFPGEAASGMTKEQWDAEVDRLSGANDLLGGGLAGGSHEEGGECHSFTIQAKACSCSGVPKKEETPAPTGEVPANSVVPPVPTPNETKDRQPEVSPEKRQCKVRYAVLKYGDCTRCHTFANAVQGELSNLGASSEGRISYNLSLGKGAVGYAEAVSVANPRQIPVVVLLADTDCDGVYDRYQVFADGPASGSSPSSLTSRVSAAIRTSGRGTGWYGDAGRLSKFNSVAR
ncbi:MAG: hypothetical protein R3B52_02120 [Candidatus Paceibacterota bacterium]